jgi:predicted ATPase
MIDQISVENFKSLRSITNLSLKPLTIIIGPNASGKSNLLDALESLQQLVRHRGTMMIRRDDEVPIFSFDDVLWRKAEPTDEISWKIVCSLGIGRIQQQSNVEYSVAVCDDRDYAKPIITRETLRATLSPEDTMIEYLSRTGTDIEVQRLEQGELSREKTEISPIDLALHAYARDTFPDIEVLADYVKRWRFFKIIADAARFTQPDVDQRWRLEKEGRNLSNILYYLSKENPTDFEYIREEMHEILGISSLGIRREELGKSLYQAHVEATESPFDGLRPFNLGNLSDGTVGMLALLTILSVTEPPPLVCIEEPERSIHPRMLGRLAHYLQEAAQRTQLIITTHNAELLDHFDPYRQENVQVLVACRDTEHATQFTAVQNIQNVQAWLDDYMLGQIWTMGQIEEMLEVE